MFFNKCARLGWLLVLSLFERESQGTSGLNYLVARVFKCFLETAASLSWQPFPLGTLFYS